MVRVFALAALTAAAACAGTGAERPTPASAARAYIAALEADDPRAAYELLSRRERAETSYDAFERAWRASEGERARAADALRDRLRGDPALGERAAVTVAEGETVHLHREAGRWVLRDPLAGPGRTPTPRDAIRRLATAVAKARVGSVLAVLTERRRDALEDRLDGFARGLAAHRDAPIERIADGRAALEWSDDGVRYRIVLLREGEQWLVDEIRVAATDP